MNPRYEPVPFDSSLADEATSQEQENGLKVSLLSFGRRVDGGAPSDLNYVFNLTHVPSPSKYLRDRLTGLSKRLQKELFQTEGVDQTYQQVRRELLDFIVTHLRRKQLRHASLERKANEEHKAEEEQTASLDEQKAGGYGAPIGSVVLSNPTNSFRIGLGCDKGLHRSVAFAERLKKELPALLKTRVGPPLLPVVVEVSHMELAQREAQRAEKQRLRKKALSEDEQLSSEHSDSGLDSASGPPAGAGQLSTARRKRTGKGKGNARRFYKHAVGSSAADD